MNRFKISRIYIKNFKHIDEATLDFSENDLIILDGPNGFGKTTIFDAIELVITGRIARIKNTIDGKFGYEQMLYSNDDSKEMDIRIEFKNDNRNVVLGKYIEANKKLLSKDKKPDNWDIFETYQLSNFYDVITLRQSITYEKIEYLLGIKNLERFFNLFYYVQQEENTMFLKKNGKERMEALSSLFDTKKEEKELELLKKAKRLVVNRKRKLDGADGEIQKNIDFISTLKIGIEDINEDKRREVKYKKIVKNKTIEWDAEKLILESETRKKYLHELRSIYRLKINFKSFLNTEFNKQLSGFLGNSTLIISAINYYSFFDIYNEFETLKRKEKSLIKIKENISKKSIEKNLKLVNFKDVSDILHLELNLKKIEDDIKGLKLSKGKMRDFSNLVQQFQLTKVELLEQYKKIGNETDPDCPLCGNTFQSYEDLVESIEVQKTKFEKLLSKEDIEYQQSLNDFYETYVIQINKGIESYLSNISNIIPDDFLNQLSEAYRKRTKITEFVEWCIKKEIEIETFFNKTNMLDIESEAKNNKILSYLEEKLRSVDVDYKNHETNKFIFENIFDSEELNVNVIEVHDIIDKSNYINYQFYNNSSKKINEYNQILTNLKKMKSKLETQELKLKEIEEIYNKEITGHWQNIIKDIEVPFYIYSGKIIQSYQLGCGLFIREKKNQDQKSIMFVSNMKNDHDAINYLSSGQLSGLIISFTLALNKVYEAKSLDILMIDDPVQTMDEINIASFTELLRNEFKDKQIILSTHEEEISKYIRYKFKKYNLEAKGINVKEVLYNS